MILVLAHVLVIQLAMLMHTIVAQDLHAIILQTKRVGTQKVARLVRHVHHLIGNAKYDYIIILINSTNAEIFCITGIFQFHTLLTQN